MKRASHIVDDSGGLEHFNYIPMRLTEDERKLFQILENALNVSEYTDSVDVLFSHTRKSKQSRIIEGLVDALSISVGLLVSNNLTEGEELCVDGRTLTDNVPLFRELFEVGRRYKIMNPTSMRNTYGKLMYMLMDTQMTKELAIDFIKPILTVNQFLKDKNANAMLSDPLLLQATKTINNELRNKSQSEVELEMKNKIIAIQKLKEAYTSDLLSESDIQRVIDSISDNEAYLRFNTYPIERMLQLLHENFNPTDTSTPYTLELSVRSKKVNSISKLKGYANRYIGGGQCLNHDHATQFTYVMQSLTLWREILLNMPKLWIMADKDMTTETYRLVDTGQGNQRLQSCPNVGSEMRRILSKVKKDVGTHWVGLSVIHLGDRDVPNALVFIDKYTQIARMLSPVCQCVDRLKSCCDDKAFHHYITEEWNSIDDLKMQILSDCFKHGFDGSGDDGGSCIDGRSTSFWNWCSKIIKKPYYYVFMFTGFQGFDGSFEKE